MGSGIITKVAVTPANVPDGNALKHACPKSAGMVFADKAYSGTKTRNTIKAKGCYDGGVIYKNNQKEKIKDKDSWTTKTRMPYEGVFSKVSKRARYRGIAKTQMQAFMEAVVHNIKTFMNITQNMEKQGITASAS